MEKIVSIVLIVVGIVLGWFIAGFFNGIPNGKVLVNQSAVDSLSAFVIFADSVRNLPERDTIITDTVYLTEIKYVDVPHNPAPEIIDSSRTFYQDSLIIDKEINAWINIMVQGHLDDLNVEWRYRPMIRSIETLVEIPVYTPIITEIEVKKYVTGHYLSVVGSGSAEMFIYGLDYSVVGGKRIVGFKYRRYGEQNVYGMSIGVNLREVFKR